MPCKKVKNANRSKPQRFVSCTNVLPKISTPAFFAFVVTKLRQKQHKNA